MVGAPFPASPTSPSRAFLWQNGVITDLNTLISGASPSFLLQASAINSRGEIVGFGPTGTGDVHAFLATPKHEGDDSHHASSSAEVAPVHRPSSSCRRMFASCFNSDCASDGLALGW